MITLVKKLDSTFGGFDYVEYDSAKMMYKTGQTRSHKGHYPGRKIEIPVRTMKELNDVEADVERLGFTYDTDWERN